MAGMNEKMMAQIKQTKKLVEAKKKLLESQKDKIIIQFENGEEKEK